MGTEQNTPRAVLSADCPRLDLPKTVRAINSGEPTQPRRTERKQRKPAEPSTAASVRGYVDDRQRRARLRANDGATARVG